MPARFSPWATIQDPIVMQTAARQRHPSDGLLGDWGDGYSRLGREGSECLGAGGSPCSPCSPLLARPTEQGEPPWLTQAA